MTGLRIGYTCHDRFPSTDTNTQQIFWTLTEMARLGHEVRLHVRALPYGADNRDAVAQHYGRGTGLPSTLRLTAALFTIGESSAAKALFDLAAPASVADADLVWTRDPLALVRAVRGRTPVVFETFRPDFAQADAFRMWRRLTLPYVRGVITHSRLAADAFVGAGVPAARVLVAHNGYAPELMEPPLSRDEARALTGLPTDAPLVVYTGHVGPQKGTEALVALAAAMPHVRVVIVGVDERAGERAWVEACAARAGARNLVLVPRVGLREVARYLYAADCLIVPPTGEPLTRYGRTVLPMKLFSYMAAGRPIAAPDLPDVREVLEHDRTALLLAPDDVAGAAAHVTALLADAPRATRLATGAREASRRYTWQARAESITQSLQAWLR